jgi:phenylacetic acid degradation operon negative regulatory protein
MTNVPRTCVRFLSCAMRDKRRMISQMKPKTEEFLYFLLWSAELLTRPTFRNVSESYEEWAYRKGLLRPVAKGLRRQVAVLKEAGLVETHSTTADDRLLRLTETGRLHALGGRDPTVQWARAWDGRWRLVLFDVPRQQNRQRDRLRQSLRNRCFGCLQGSLWITPEPLTGVREQLAGGRINVKSLILFEGMPSGGENDAQIVAGAWDFAEINRRYTKEMKVLDQFPSAPPRDSATAAALQRWAAAERQAWFDAVSKDPLLPERLLPQDYLGRSAWHQRVQVLAQAGERLQGFGR